MTEPDRQQFTSFMQSYQDMVFSTAVRLLGNEAQAEDISQEVFLRAYQQFAQLRHSVTAGGWLKAVARNLALNHLSRYRRRWWLFSEVSNDDDQDSLLLELPTPTDHLLEQLHDQQQLQRLEQCLQNLPAHLRVPLVLFHFEALPYETIAQQLNVSLAKVKTDIYRARVRLAQQVQAMHTAATVNSDSKQPLATSNLDTTTLAQRTTPRVATKRNEP